MKLSQKVISAALIMSCASLSANSFVFAFERGIGGGSGSAGPPPTGDYAATPASAGWTVLGGSTAVSLDNTTANAFSAISEGQGSNAYPALSSWNPGFLFISGRNDAPAPQVFFAFTNNLGATTQSVSGYGGSMQTEWLTNADFSLNGRTFSDLQSLSVYSNPRTTDDKAFHFAIELPTGWVVASEAFAPTATTWANLHLLADPQNATWLGGFYDTNAGTLATSAAALSSVSISGDTPILGYGILSFTGNAVGQNDSWIRFDDYMVTAIPEPSTWAALLGLGALALVGLRRRTRR